MAYVLDERGDPAVEPDIGRWIDWMNEARAAGRLRAGVTRIKKYIVSTVFTGMSSEDPPKLWETVVLFSSEFDRLHVEKYIYRYLWSGRFEDAQARHDEIVKKVSEIMK